MAEAALEFDAKELLVSNNAFGPREIAQLLHAINEDFSHFGQLREAVQVLEQEPSRESREPDKAWRRTFLARSFS